MFQVRENGRPCDYHSHNVDRSWDKSVWATFEEAFAYAKLWLGEVRTLPQNWDGKPYDYNGHKDIISIVEIRV